ncbi:MAG: hypothetical protein ACK41C_05990 [Phenylobacterium sp.]|uniref:hypothetical protein n=1 Tax=Phenylobacterium sp. TaxID=1871053 RepID=UPI00391C232F
MRPILPVFGALALAACQPQAPNGEPAAPPADAPVAGTPFAGDFDARGTEPFWAVQIRPTGITLIRPEPEPPVVAPNPGPAADGARAVWSSTAADGRAFVVALSEAPGCSDGMSDLAYPYAATVTLGEETFSGCGAKASEMPREGG